MRVGGTPRSGGYPRSRNARGVSRFNLQRYEGTKVPSKVVEGNKQGTKVPSSYLRTKVPSYGNDSFT